MELVLQLDWRMKSLCITGRWEGETYESEGEERSGKPIYDGADNGSDEGSIIERAIPRRRRKRNSGWRKAAVDGYICEEHGGDSLKESRFPEARFKEAMDGKLLTNAHVRGCIRYTREECGVEGIGSVEYKGLVAADSAGELDTTG